MKKNISIIIVIIIIINVLLSNIVVVATDLRGDSQTFYTPKQSTVETWMKTGEMPGSTNTSDIISGEKVQVSKESNRTTEPAPSTTAGIASLIGHGISIISGLINALLTSAAGIDTTATNTGFTIENLVFNKYELFDINVFNKDIKTEHASEMSKTLKDSVADWYASLRTLAIMLSVVVLIYIAIRMATSTVADQKARYKQMFQTWLFSFAMIFVLHYVIIVFVYVSDMLVSIFASLAGEENFENYLVSTIGATKTTGWETLLGGIMYFMVVIYQVRFFLLYFKRLLSNAFLILIAPLITVTYSIDKVGDNKAQAFKNWGQEMTTNMLIQPLHALMILIFFYSALEIAKMYPIIGILFLFGLGRVETLLKQIFKLRGSTISSVHSQLNADKLFGITPFRRAERTRQSRIDKAEEEKAKEKEKQEKEQEEENA